MTKEWNQSELNRIYKDNPELQKVPIAGLDEIVVEFLKLHDVNASPPKKKSNLKEGAKAAAIGAIAGLDFAGDAIIIEGQKDQTIKQEWTSWKQWALSHKDFPEYKTKFNSEAEEKNKKIDNALADPIFIEKWETYFKKTRDEEFVKNQKATKKRAIGLIALLAFLGTVIGVTRPPEESFNKKIAKQNIFTKDNFGENWPFNVDSFELKCKKARNYTLMYIANVDGKSYSFNSTAKFDSDYPYPDEILDTNGLNNLRKLQASKSNWRKFEPFEGLLNINDMDYTIGNSPLGEAMDDFCGN